MFWEKGQSLPADLVGGFLTQAGQGADPVALVLHHMKNLRDLQVSWLHILALYVNGATPAMVHFLFISQWFTLAKGVLDIGKSSVFVPFMLLNGSVYVQ